jgi:hypothetical protein
MPEASVSDSLDAGDLQIGHTYRIEFDDCCVTGWFESKFTGLSYFGDNEASGIHQMLFEHAALDDMGSGWIIREVT